MIGTVVTFGALLLSLAVIMVGNGLQGTLIIVRASLEGFSPEAIGLLTSGYFTGFIGGCFLAQAIVLRVGHVRSFAVLAAVAACSALTHVLIIDPWLWWGLRVVTGFCFSGLFMVMESWINEQTENATRGRVLAVYRMVDLGSTTAGQLLLPIADPASFTLFAMISILLCLALIPVSLTTAPTPLRMQRLRFRPLRLFRISPLGVVGCFAVGLANSAYWGLAPIFVQQAGHGATGVSWFMSCGILGGTLLQWPIGWISDRIDRRKVMVPVAFLGAVSSVALAVVGFAALGPALILAALFGSFGFALYSLAVAHTNDHCGPDEFVEVSGSLLTVFGIGAMLGPILAATSVGAIGLWGLLAFTAAVHVVLGLYGLWRMKQTPAVPVTGREGFTPVSGTTPALLDLDARAEGGAPKRGNRE
jgi:MFS family permease